MTDHPSTPAPAAGEALLPDLMRGLSDAICAACWAIAVHAKGNPAADLRSAFDALCRHLDPAGDGSFRRAQPAAGAGITARDRIVWRSAITAAENVCIAKSNRARDEWFANAMMAMHDHIKQQKPAAGAVGEALLPAHIYSPPSNDRSGGYVVTVDDVQWLVPRAISPADLRAIADHMDRRAQPAAGAVGEAEAHYAIAHQIIDCADSWEGDARLLGNIRARDMSKCVRYLLAMAHLRELERAQQPAAPVGTDRDSTLLYSCSGDPASDWRVALTTDLRVIVEGRAPANIRHAAQRMADLLRDERAKAAPVVSEADAVLAEVQRATAKYPTWPTDPLHALAVLGEEFGELTKAVLQHTYEPHKATADDVREEAVQTAAMALRFLVSLNRYAYRQGEQHQQAAPLQAGAGGGEV